ncbi:Maf-like protein YhdE [Bremerella volcania]|uniref:dTTP/UTP pyrophosphatase n=1 Tax=Bremerella volcania TaxID=2527984 RepID=A0A518C7Q4_9BACT|nr:nucleoside triphosphate pyrophosphatase [Bremerella volcania]QDU75230.1 Maf-like protein YhdE [Bremerella volcania]
MMAKFAESLILASQSPRRQLLLKEAGYDVTVVTPSPHAETPPRLDETPRESVLRIAREKAEDVAGRVEKGVILAGDTLAELHGQPLGKPTDRDHAREILRALRGQDHFVWSAICLWRRPTDEIIVDVDRTTVKMAPLSDEEIEEYLDSGLWEGKAGAFGIQDRTGWVDIDEGSLTNVVGLPMELLSRMLSQMKQ